MLNSRTSLIIGLAASAVLGSSFAATANAAPTPVNIVNASRAWFDLTETVQSGDVGGPAGVMVAKAGQRALVITDVVITHNVNTTTDTFRVNFRRGPASNANDCDSAGLILGPYVSPGETVSVNMSTGLRLLPGEQLCVVVGGTADANEGVTFTLTGYETGNTGP
jgi:hypothetical protein